MAADIASDPGVRVVNVNLVQVFVNHRCVDDEPFGEVLGAEPGEHDKSWECCRTFRRGETLSTEGLILKAVVARGDGGGGAYITSYFLGGDAYTSSIIAFKNFNKNVSH